eukprot:scaffold1769_cov132-Skeletonema_dohrnii-CCMP3373.AAC.20
MITYLSRLNPEPIIVSKVRNDRALHTSEKELSLFNVLLFDERFDKVTAITNRIRLSRREDCSRIYVDDFLRRNSLI